MVVNQQSKITLNLLAVRSYVRKVRTVLNLQPYDFNVCFADDAAICKLNGAYRKNPKPTDVLSFSWRESNLPVEKSVPNEFKYFLGDVVISVETARQNALREEHSLEREIHWLILHGVLHLLGYDHERDHGEMILVELSLRERLGINGNSKRGNRRPTSRKWSK